MSGMSKADAQQRVDRIHAFQQELNQLQQEQVFSLTEQQSLAITAHHQNVLQTLGQDFDVDVNQSGKQLTLGMQIASFLGALALACSVFFLFYQYWGFFSTAVQVIVLVSAPILTFALSCLIRCQEQTGYFAKLMALISFACYVLNISMLGQIFNLTPTDNALLVWCFYAAILAYAFDIRLLLAIAIVCFYGFVAARVGAWGGLYWLSMGERPENFFLPAVLLFCLPSVFSHKAWYGFESIYRVLAICGLLLAVLVLSFWGSGSYLSWDEDVIEGFYQLLGFSLSVVFMVLGVRKGWTTVMNTANVFFVIFLYTKFFDWWWDVMPKYLFFLVIGLTALLFLVVFNRLRRHMKNTAEMGA